jgi:nitrate reductase NapD
VAEPDVLADPGRRRLLTGAHPDASPLVHVASFIVRAFPERLPAVLAEVRARGAFEVVAAQDSRLVLLAETPSARHSVEHLSDLESIPGVLGAVLVYHHAETAAQLAEVIPDGPDPT